MLLLLHSAPLFLERTMIEVVEKKGGELVVLVIDDDLLVTVEIDGCHLDNDRCSFPLHMMVFVSHHVLRLGMRNASLIANLVEKIFRFAMRVD